MNRPRSRANGELPDNLYRKSDKRTGKDYYSYKDIRDGSWHGLGSDKEAAINDALALNAAIYATIRSQKLLAIQTQATDGATLNRAFLHHMKVCEDRKLAYNTIATRKSQAGAIIAGIGKDRDIRSITVGDAALLIKKYEAQGKDRTARAIRTAGMEMWKDAIAEGWCETNIWQTTRNPSVEVKRSRLLLDAFWEIHKYANTLTKEPWIARSMELALVSVQRREDIALAEFKASAKPIMWVDGGMLRVIPQKTEKKSNTRLEIPLDVTIQGLTLGQVVASCRADNVVSRYLVHHTAPHAFSKPGDPVWKDTISRGFQRCRDVVGIVGENGKNPPTFHEIRSLAIREYTKAYGPEVAQAMAGHKEAATTDIYRDIRGAEWARVVIKSA